MTTALPTRDAADDATASCPGPAGPVRRVRGAAAFLVILWGLYQNLFNLTGANWAGDELNYRSTGREYVIGWFNHNFEHPFTGKYLLGIAQAIFGRHEFVVRLVPVTASLIVAGLLFALIRQAVGYWSAMTAAALWMLLPRGAPGLPARIDRFAMLEPLVAAGYVAALAAGWQWAQRGQWRWALATGALAGFATSVKLSGALVLPGILLCGLVARKGRPFTRLLQATVAGLASLAVFAMSYLPAGARGPEAFRYMIEKQSLHNTRGHLVSVAGEEYLHPPWWTNLWFQYQGYGLGLTIVLLVGAIAALAIRRHRALATYLLLATLIPAAALSFVPSVALPYYFYLWQPPLVALVALGLAGMASCRGAIPRLAAAVAVVVCSGAAGATSIEIARLKQTDYDRLDETDLARRVTSIAHAVVVLGDIPRVAVHLPDFQTVVGTVPPRTRVDAVVIDCAYVARYPRSPVLGYVSRRSTNLRMQRIDNVLLYLSDVGTKSGPPSSSASAAC